MQAFKRSLTLLAGGVILSLSIQAGTGGSATGQELLPGQSEYAERAERMLTAAIEAGDELSTVRAQHELAQHMKALSLFPQALTHAGLAREAARDIDDAHLRLAIEVTYASLLAQVDRSAEAAELLLASLDSARALGDVEQQQWALLGLSSAYVSSRRLEEAADFGQQGLALARARGDNLQQVRFLNNLGLIAHTAGDMETANTRIREALAVDAGELPPDVHGALIIASITLAGTTGEDNAKRARELIRDARRDGNPYIEGFASEQLGHILCTSGELEQGLEAFAAAHPLFHESDRLGDLRRLHERWAACLALAGQFEGALEKQRAAMEYLGQVHKQRQDEALQAHDIAFRTEQRMAELARLTAEEQALQARVARQRAFTGWVAAGGLLLLGIAAGFWVRNRNLRHQRDAQLALQQARIDLLARTSHEIRNPAQGIIGILEGQAARDERWAGDKNLDAALAAARMVGHLSNDYLELALYEQGRLTVNSDAVCHLPTLIERVGNLSRSFIKSPAQTLTCRNAGQLPEFVYGDDQRLTQVLLNLISNAAYYGEEGAITLTASADPDHRQLRFEVADCGPGFGAAGTANFDPYVRGDGHHNNPRGSGLGLAVSARLVAAMGGTLTARNRPEGGAMLAVSLPLRVAEAAARTDHHPAHSLPAAPTTSRRVLIVDDDPFARLGLKVLAESAGAQVRELSSGTDLEQVLRDFDPEIVLLDFQLGAETGLELAARIRRLDSDRPTPRVTSIVSGSGDETEADPKIIDRWLIKPVGRDAIAELMQYTQPL